MKRILMTLLAVFMLVGCGGGETADKNQKESFVFEINDVVIKMNEETSNVLTSLGKEISYFEAKSCAFDGLDKTYTYQGFQLITYPDNEKDYVNSVVLTDDTVTTKEGVYIGDDKTHVLDVYGSSYEEKSGSFVYTKGDSTLEIIFENDKVVSIVYRAIVK